MRIYPDELWKEIEFEPGSLRFRYAVSNYGRIVSFSDRLENGKLLRGGLLGGYPTFVCRPFGKSRTLYIHKLVAERFLTRPDLDHAHVIHLDYNKLNNHLSNLQWATKKMTEEHQQQSPMVLRSRAKRREQRPSKGHKLTTTDVIRIKKRIFDPNRKTRLKIIAKQFGISEMQLYRIKSGENWGHVKVDMPGQTEAAKPKSNGAEVNKSIGQNAAPDRGAFRQSSS